MLIFLSAFNFSFLNLRASGRRDSNPIGNGAGRGTKFRGTVGSRGFFHAFA